MDGICDAFVIGQKWAEMCEHDCALMTGPDRVWITLDGWRLVSLYRRRWIREE